MRVLGSVEVFAALLWAQTRPARIPADDAVRIREFYRLTGQIQDSDYQPFDAYAGQCRAHTLSDLQQADLAAWKHVAFHAFGAAEGILPDRLHPDCKSKSFTHPFSLGAFLED